jgi:hypothetical protein
MPAYATSPFAQPPNMLLSGDVGYSFGSMAKNTPTSRLQVTSVAIASNVCTLGVTLLEGLVPTAGSLISVQGTSTDSGVANVTNVAITSVSGFTTGDDSTGTIVYPATGSNQSTTPDSGTALVPVPEVYETVTTGEKGQAFAVPLVAPAQNSGDSIAWSYFFQTGAQPGTASVQLQGAQFDVDAQYSVIDSGTSTSGETRTASLSNIKPKFLRVVMATLSSGTSPYKAIAKIGA